MPPPPKTTTDPLLIDEPGHIGCLLGNEAIVRGALEAGLVFMSGYPGTPSSEVTDSFARIAPSRGIHFEYSVNEKVALEMAFAASLAGGRALCAMKHLGLMAAGDPLSTIPYVGAVGGLVIVSAGDPSCHTSPNEQDQRWLGPMLHLPILDPSTPAAAHTMTRGAFELSERCRLPVLLRITARVAHTSAMVSFGPLREGRATGFVRDPQRFVPIPANARRLRREIPERLEAAAAWMDRAELFHRSGDGSQAILACGSPAATTADLIEEHDLSGAVVLATLGQLHPLPEQHLLDLARSVERLLVIEELSPFVEDALAAMCQRHGVAVQILGKRSGHLPVEFEYTPEIIQEGLASALGLACETPAATQHDDPALAGRPPVLCAGCPHRSTYFAARAAFDADQLYFNDIGCYTLGFGAPLDTADALLCMGAGFTLAAGVSRVTGKRTVGFLGDSTFFHAGMPALLNAIKEQDNIVAVILDNQVTAMTGFQESPLMGLDESGLRRDVSIESVVRSLGATQVETVDPMDLPATIAAFERARDASGVAVVIAEQPCPIHQEHVLGAPDDVVPYRIEQSLCQSCGREACGMRCAQSTDLPLERATARARALDATAARDCAPPPVAPCAPACPLGLCVQGYAGLIAAGRYAEALSLIMERCALPDSVCRVCDRPCETSCVRNDVDEPIAINDLKRFVTDWAAEQGDHVYTPQREPDHGRAVAVIGAGPAGLVAAHDLRLAGYAVTLFDARDEPGGLLRYGIPGYRLPTAAVQRDVRRILDLGVTFRGGLRLGREITLDGLLDDGFDAVLLALGAGRPRSLDVEGSPGRGSPRVLDALGYLTRVTTGEVLPESRQVVVVGGGNAACDAARSALRLGAASVTIAYRREREQMPALIDEVLAAEREGVIIADQLAPLAVRRDDRPGLLCVATRPGPADDSGRRSPEPVPEDERLLPADLILVAVGQDPELGELADELETGPGHTLTAQRHDGSCSLPRVFAAGDVTGAERTVTAAMASGQRAAWGIDCELRGENAARRHLPAPLPSAWPDAQPAPVARRRAAARRRRPDELSPDRCRQGFDEVLGSLSETAAREEAARCAICGQCGNCRSCLDLFACPAFFVDDGCIQIDAALCNGCGVCADFCNTGAIVPVEDGAP